MMPRMHFGIARMNVLDNYNNDDEMTVLFLKMFYLMVIGYMLKIQGLNDQIISYCFMVVFVFALIVFVSDIKFFLYKYFFSFPFLFIFLPKIVFQFRIKLYLYHIVFVFCCHLSDSPIVQRILMSFQLCCSPHPQCFTLRCNVFQSKCNVLRSKCNPMQYHP